VPSIKGRFEYDDEDLSPGKKKEGGLHQNLYDSQGELKGSARFIPDDGAEAEPEVVIHHVYHEAAPAAKTREQEEFEQAMRKLAYRLLRVAATRLKPHTQRFWHEQAMPAMRSKVDKVKNRKAHRNAVTALAPPKGSPPEVVAAFEGFKADMSSAEARARYVLALAARAFSDEQMRIVARANIVDDENFGVLRQAMSELSPEQVATIIKALVANPSQAIPAIDAMWPPRLPR
jgi:hypothetical protein